MEERGLKIFAPEEEEPGKDSDVFFNDEMRTNRDLSRIALKVFRDKIDVDEFRICDPLSASGVRGFRYSDLGKLYLNDTNPEAVDSIEKGLEENQIEAQVYNKDANVLLSENRNLFHFIDIDPFGPFNRFLDSTARASNHQSFVGLTATDLAAPAGSYKKTCMRRYSSKPLKNSFMHETGLRIYIKEVFQNYARFDKCFDPKICWHEQHYSRVMGRVTESKKRTNRTLDNIGYLSYCPECRWRKLEREEECGNCGEDTQIAGPLWTGKLVDRRFTKEMKEEIPEEWVDANELLRKVHGEAEILTPFYDLHKLSSSLSIQVPKREKVLESLEDRGYPVSRTHFSPTGFRTDAPLQDIRRVLKEASEE
ncbi:MAG: tRNA (guanine(10)-N(2))-dimethyltransferase [Nanohaloarchaea archaeon]|nr:tRNA (guanine(10)-N(2))-dimethyltransferase [Candidatus Nanohaloarchaea archaeon]